jgi:hypothetical protein
MCLWATKLDSLTRVKSLCYDSTGRRVIGQGKEYVLAWPTLSNLRRSNGVAVPCISVFASERLTTARRKGE